MVALPQTMTKTTTTSGSSISTDTSWTARRFCARGGAGVVRLRVLPCPGTRCGLAAPDRSLSDGVPCSWGMKFRSLILWVKNEEGKCWNFTILRKWLVRSQSRETWSLGWFSNKKKMGIEKKCGCEIYKFPPIPLAFIIIFRWSVAAVWWRRAKFAPNKTPSQVTKKTKFSTRSSPSKRRSAI